MRKIKISYNNRLIIEFVSVSFAVFLALIVNQWKDSHNNKILAEESIKNLHAEIIDNESNIKAMTAAQKKLLIKIDSLLATGIDTTQDLDLRIGFKLMSSNSWETAKLTEAILYIDIDLVKEMSGIYKLQDYYEAIVKDYVLKNFYIHDDNEAEKQAESIQYFLQGIIPVEENLLASYQELLRELDDKN